VFQQLAGFDLSFSTGSDLPKAIILQPVQTQNDVPKDGKIVSENPKSQRRPCAVKLRSAGAGNLKASGLRLIRRRAAAPSSVALVLVPLLALLLCGVARADVGVLLNESLDTSVARITGTGHSAIYFSRICPESPVKLRLCRPGESGSVMSNYTTLGEDQPFEWNIVPLPVYLYGVEDLADRPLFGTWKIKRALEERYREKFLAGYCESQSCRTSGKAEWREMVGAALERSMYLFVVSTTVEQDEALIAEFNSSPNENHFNGVTRNCATFSRRVLNTYFPGASRADYLNDFGMTTPKAVARSFAHYGEKHSQTQFYVLHFAQLPGTIKRSSECRNATEQLYHSKKLLVPMLIFADHELPFVAASYLLTGRFNPEHELEHHSTPQSAELDRELRAARADGDATREVEIERLLQGERAEIVGTAEEWKQYREDFDFLAADAVSREIIPNRDFLDHFFKFLDKSGTISIEPSGALWISLAQGGKSAKVGISASNVLASGAEPQWAYALTLARTDHYLKSPKHSREIMPEFRADWNLLELTRANSSNQVTTAALPVSAPRGIVPVGQLQ
jgi:hypothetical protein